MVNTEVSRDGVFPPTLDRIKTANLASQSSGDHRQLRSIRAQQGASGDPERSRRGSTARRARRKVHRQRLEKAQDARKPPISGPSAPGSAQTRTVVVDSSIPTRSQRPREPGNRDASHSQDQQLVGADTQLDDQRDFAGLVSSSGNDRRQLANSSDELDHGIDRCNNGDHDRTTNKGRSPSDTSRTQPDDNLDANSP